MQTPCRKEVLMAGGAPANGTPHRRPFLVGWGMDRRLRFKSVKQNEQRSDRKATSFFTSTLLSKRVDRSCTNRFVAAKDMIPNNASEIGSYGQADSSRQLLSIGSVNRGICSARRRDTESQTAHRSFGGTGCTHAPASTSSSRGEARSGSASRCPPCLLQARS